MTKDVAGRLYLQDYYKSVTVRGDGDNDADVLRPVRLQSSRKQMSHAKTKG